MNKQDKMPDEIWVNELNPNNAIICFGKLIEGLEDPNPMTSYLRKDLVNLKSQSVPISALEELVRKCKKELKGYGTSTIAPPPGHWVLSQHIEDLQQLVEPGRRDSTALLIKESKDE